MESLSNKRFLALEWRDSCCPWQNTLTTLDESILHFSSLCVNSPHLYLFFAMIPGALFWARSITGHLQDYLLKDFRLIDLHRGPVKFRRPMGLEVWEDPGYFSSLRDKKERGLVEIVQVVEDNVSRYIFRESQPPALPLRFL